MMVSSGGGWSTADENQYEPGTEGVLPYSVVSPVINDSLRCSSRSLAPPNAREFIAASGFERHGTQKLVAMETVHPSNVHRHPQARYDQHPSPTHQNFNKALLLSLSNILF